MHIKEVDVRYWQQRQLPSWASTKFKVLSINIDRIVNEQGPLKPGHLLNPDRDLHNALGLLHLVRKNYGSSSLAEYMRGYKQRDGRDKWYRRWARKIAIGRFERVVEHG